MMNTLLFMGLGMQEIINGDESSNEEVKSEE